MLDSNFGKENEFQGNNSPRPGIMAQAIDLTKRVKVAVQKATEGQDKPPTHNFVFSRTTEDSELGTKLLDIQPTDRILVVAGSGDQVLDALCFGPQKLYAADISWDQLKLTQLKVIFAKYLERKDFAEALGWYEHEDSAKARKKRENQWMYVFSKATPEEKELLWEFQDEISEGIVDTGKSNTSRTKAQFLLKALKAVLPTDFFEIMIGEKGTPAERQKLQVPKYALEFLKKITLLAPLMISPRIVAESDTEHLSTVYGKGLDNFYAIYLHGLTHHPLSSHLFAKSLDACPKEGLPLHLREESFAKLQAATRKNDGIEYVHGDMGKLEFWKRFDNEALDKLYLSSVPVYLPKGEKVSFLSFCSGKLRPGARIFTCSHDTKPPFPPDYRHFITPLPVQREQHIGQKPSNYTQELLFQAA